MEKQTRPLYAHVKSVHPWTWPIRSHHGGTIYIVGDHVAGEGKAILAEGA